MNIEECINEFNIYVSNYNMKNPNIKLKYKHSFRVMEIIEEIAIKMKLSSEDVTLAKVIGLLHDIGRFEQLKEFKTYKDIDMDHGEYGAKVLFENGLIRKFVSSKKYDNIIRKAIKEHNKFKITGRFNEKELLFAKLIRDADKIDIFKVVTMKKWSGFVHKPTKEVVDTFMNKETIDNKITKNGTDSTIARMAFLYDLNFKESFEVLREKKYFEKWLDSIKVGDDMKEEFEKFKKISLEKLKEGV